MHSSSAIGCKLLAGLTTLTLAACSTGTKADAEKPGASDDGFMRDFGLDQRKLATTGRSPYFVLEPGYQLVLAHDEDRLTITVLDETHRVGNVTTRVVEEREEESGELHEVSRNYFAIDPATNDVFYFGEQVDVYKNGKVTSHPGEWRAGEKGARAGLMTPGKPVIGAKYYQEIAPGVAMDRAEIVDLSATLKTNAGEFKGCLKTHESTGLDKQESESKTYAPGIGLIQDEELLLVSYGKASER